MKEETDKGPRPADGITPQTMIQIKRRFGAAKLVSDGIAKQQKGQTRQVIRKLCQIAQATQCPQAIRPHVDYNK